MTQNMKTKQFKIPFLEEINEKLGVIDSKLESLQNEQSWKIR